jgi:hypothetical protein
LKGGDGASIDERISRLGEVSSVTAEAQEDGTVKLSFFVPEMTAAGNAPSGEGIGLPAGERIFDWAVANNLKILGMSRKKLSLEDIFVSLTAEEKK